uniref:Reverse transcriptase domain-containing protein n=1 Tax=Tanacetum cinerariifolium TaxID=118510 RepID=A0A699GQK2_TANCI|nr:reverse transcriptase domain-containing protein [Tanacetum cinerariifolium]
MQTINGMVRGKTNKKGPNEQSKQWMNNKISFPFVSSCQLVDSLIILEALIEGLQIHQIYMNEGSSSEVMYEHCFQNLGTETMTKLKEPRTPLVGFSSKDKEESRGKEDKTRESNKSLDINGDEKCKEKEELSEKPLENKPLKKVWLSRKLAALNRFLSKADKRALSCLDTLKKCTNKKDFYWTTEAEEAFQAMKKLIVELPTLTAPKKEEELMVYLSTTIEVVNDVLLVERDGMQTPIYYVNRTLEDTIAEDNLAHGKIDGPDDTLTEEENLEEQRDDRTPSTYKS